MLIGLFVWDEHQYDKNVPDGDRIYRLYNTYTNNDGSDDRAVVPPMFTTTLQQEFPEVKAKLWGNHLWSPSYFAASCGGAPLAIVKQYIESQRT